MMLHCREINMTKIMILLAKGRSANEKVHSKIFALEKNLGL